MKHPGKLITFEGLDGCGKSTQLAREAERLRRQGFAVTITQEPGGTSVGQRLRQIVLDAAGREISPLTELALMFAARAQHIEQVIRPALQAGQMVLCDRFTDSSVAYQGYGRGVSLDVIRGLESLLCQGVRPDLTVILDLAPDTGALRTEARNRAASQPATRFEQEGGEFFRRVREGYWEIARQEPERVRLLDARGSIEEVQERVRQVVEAFLRAVRTGGSNAV